MGPWHCLLFVPALALAACEDGVYLEVRAPDGAKEVELFIGEAPCAIDGVACDHLTPEASTTRVDGRVSFRDRAARYTAPVEDGRAWIRLGREESTLPVVIAVALGDAPEGPETPLGVAVIEDLSIAGTQQIIIELAPAAPWRGDVSEQRKHAATLWANRECIGVSTGTGVVYVVPKDDPDCDSDAARRECDPLAYLSEDSPAGCIGYGEGNVCIVGQRGCSETDPAPPDQCVPTGPIIPPDFCEQCIGASDLDGCIGDALNDHNNVRLECSLYGRLVGAGFRACDNGPAIIMNVDGTPLAVTEIGLAALAPPNAPVAFFPTYPYPEPAMGTAPQIDATMNSDGNGTIDWDVATSIELGSPMHKRLLMHVVERSDPAYAKVFRADFTWAVSPDCDEEPTCALTGRFEGAP